MAMATACIHSGPLKCDAATFGGSVSLFLIHGTGRITGLTFHLQALVLFLQQTCLNRSRPGFMRLTTNRANGFELMFCSAKQMTQRLWASWPRLLQVHEPNEE
jgi:hypothetical protein